MQKWVYLYLKARGDEVLEANGHTIPGNVDITIYLQSAGNEGWELVGMLPSGYASDWRLVFKRPAN
jgi:hypothetical protein